MLELWLNSYWQGVVIVAGVSAIAALGLQLTIASGQFSLVHGALMGAAAYLAGVSAVRWGFGMWPAVLAGGAFGAVLGGIVSLLVLRLDGLLLGIATLAIGQALSLAASNSNALGSSNGYTGIPLRTHLWQVMVVLVVALAVLMLLKRSRVGLGLVAAGRDPVAAQSLGISPTTIRLYAFAAGGGLAGLAGGLNAQYLSFVGPGDLGFAVEVQLLLYVVLGGMTTPLGAVLGTFGVTIGSELLRFTQLDRAWIFGLVLMFAALGQPEGLLRRRRVRPRVGT
jgi:branched-chain amino acid transport system permease protein